MAALALPCVWSQTKAGVAITIKADHASSCHAWCRADGRGQGATTLILQLPSDEVLLELPLHAPVVSQPQACLPAAGGGLRIEIRKLTESRWPRLTSHERDPSAIKVDWSKYQGDEDDSGSDDEDYDAYLMRTYGVSSNWRGPGSGDRPPVLGGRTPGQVAEEHEFEQLMEDAGGGHADIAPSTEHTQPPPSSPVAKVSPLGAILAMQWVRNMITIVRGFEFFAWMIPAGAAVLWCLDDTRDSPLESSVYPLIPPVAATLGSLDVFMVAVGASQADGPFWSALAGWIKRSFIAVTFLMYEAQFTHGHTFLKRACGCVMLSAWTLRKTLGYAGDLSQSLWIASTLRASTAVEAALEAAFLIAHVRQLPQGITFFGASDPMPFIAATLFVAIIGDVVVLWPLFRGSSGRQREGGKAD